MKLSSIVNLCLYFNFIFILLLLTTGCAKTYPHPTFKGPTNSETVWGISRILADHKDVDVLFVHGMCSHDSTWVKKINLSLLEALKFDDSVIMGYRKKKLVPTKPDLPHDSELYKEEFKEPNKNVTVYSSAIVWTPAVKEIKKKLCYDKTEGAVPPDTVEICKYEEKACEYEGEYKRNGVSKSCPYKYKRAKFNAGLKSTLISDCFSDTIAYLGPSGSMIRADIRAALTKSSLIKAGDATPERPLFIITHSLGSKILFDLISDIKTKAIKAKKIINENNEKITKINEETKRIRNEIDVIRKEIDVIRKRIDENRPEGADLKQEQEKLAKLEKENKTLEKENKTLEKENKTLEKENNTEKLKIDTETAFNNMVDRTVTFFMYANQLPLLALSKDHPGVDSNISSYQRMIENALGDNKEGGNKKPSIVAFTDPNDLFSYTLFGSKVPLEKPEKQQKQESKYNYLDVVLSNTGTYIADFGFFAIYADPFEAHRGYATNCHVQEIVANGYNPKVPYKINCE